MASLVLIVEFEDVCIAYIWPKENMVALGRGIFGVQEFDTFGVVFFAHHAQFCHAQFAAHILVVILEYVCKPNIRSKENWLTLRPFFDVA
jgi:hypothetical protein